eukprot:10821643-Alexandrium_andersonii.AAC.1
MSASLVGSEMCIRDRRAAACAHRSLRVGSDRVTCRAAGLQGQPWGSAVSYTHLTLPTICSV